MIKKKLLCIAVAVALFVPSTSFATGAIAGATLPEQIVQEATQVEQLSNIVTQVQQGFQSLYNQAMNLKSLAQNPVPNLAPLMSQLIGAVQQGTNLSYAGQNITAQFQSLFPSWQPGQDYSQQYQNWQNTTQANWQNELSAAGLQAQNFTNENQALNSSLALSQSAQGRMQAIQAGNQISAMLVQQIQELRQLIMNEQQSQVTYKMQQLKAEQAANQQSQSTMNTFVGSGNMPSVGSQSFSGATY